MIVILGADRFGMDVETSFIFFTPTTNPFHLFYYMVIGYRVEVVL